MCLLHNLNLEAATSTHTRTCCRDPIFSERARESERTNSSEMAPLCLLYVLRHGRSLANEASLIVSSEENGVKPEYALAPAGKEQAAAAGKLLADELLWLGADADADATTAIRVTFYVSPFSRTVETAAIAAQAFEEAVASAAAAAGTAAATQTPRVLNLAGPPRVERALRERWFGAALELQNHDGYSPAWASDAKDPSSRPPGQGDGESVREVAARCAELLQRLAERHGGAGSGGEGGEEQEAQEAIVLVSHGDTLSILQAAASGGGGGSLCEHRKFGLSTAELKRVGSLPDAARKAAEVAATGVAAR
jgi:broad specificity phosphatase PhoE